MAYFEWNSQVELEHPLINAHHKRLFELSEAVAQSVADAPDARPAEPALRDLIAFAREHFAAEEGGGGSSDRSAPAVRIRESVDFDVGACRDAAA